MATATIDERFFRYQLRAIRRYQRIHSPSTPEEAAWLALEWVNRYAATARSRWEQLTNPKMTVEHARVKR